MRMLRTVMAALVAVLMLAGLVSATSVGATAGSQPKRMIVEQDPGEHQVTFNAFRLKGKITEPQADGTFLPYAKGKVTILKKACQKCKWKKAKVVKTNKSGVFKTRIFAPEKGRWRWRSKVAHSGDFANTKGQVWTLYFD